MKGSNYAMWQQEISEKYSGTPKDKQYKII